jgi:hypothetical protein
MDQDGLWDDESRVEYVRIYHSTSTSLAALIMGQMGKLTNHRSWPIIAGKSINAR